MLVRPLISFDIMMLMLWLRCEARGVIQHYNGCGEALEWAGGAGSRGAKGTAVGGVDCAQGVRASRGDGAASVAMCLVISYV